jgi:hypothetical protein
MVEAIGGDFWAGFGLGEDEGALQHRLGANVLDPGGRVTLGSNHVDGGLEQFFRRRFGRAFGALRAAGFGRVGALVI